MEAMMLRYTVVLLLVLSSSAIGADRPPPVGAVYTTGGSQGEEGLQE